jgi:hypothetical protein
MNLKSTLRKKYLLKAYDNIKDSFCSKLDVSFTALISGFNTIQEEQILIITEPVGHS